ncbi:MAG: HDIG domain-containing metalloprotein [candidate division WOR-3 bacterium]
MTIPVEAHLERLGRPYRILRELGAGQRLYLVGGTVRDLILGREPADFDFAVSGSGIEFARRFSRRLRGRLVLLSEPDDEARVVYRRRLVFDFNGLGERTIEADLGRRDFTINALAWELCSVGAGKLLDPYGGQRDLTERKIRPVSSDSLRRDPLRLLRAFRLALELGFEIDTAVLEQGRNVSLSTIAAERIGMELLRIMEAPGSGRYIEELQRVGRLGEILPQFVPVLEDSQLFRHSLDTYLKIEELVTGPSFFSRFEPEWERYFSGLPYRRALLKLAGLLHDIAKPQTRFTDTENQVHFYGHDSLGARIAARMVGERLRLSRPQVKMIRILIQEHMRLHLLATTPELSERAIRRYFRDLGDEAFGLMILCFADGWATAGRTRHLEETINRMLEQKRAEDARVKVPRLVTGHDLIALGMKPGPAFRVILAELEELQLEGKITTKEEGIAYLKSHLGAGQGDETSGIKP